MLIKRLRNPITQKRLLRFKEVKRAYLSFWILVCLYLLSLGAELICNNTPLYARFNGKSFFPIFKYYPEDTFAGNGKNTRPNYHKIKRLPVFNQNDANFMIFPPFPYGPYESVDAQSIPVADQVILVLTPLPLVGTVNIDKGYTIRRSASFGLIVAKQESRIKGLLLPDIFKLPKEIGEAVKRRFANLKAARISARTQHLDGRQFEVSLSTFTPRKKTPRSVRLTFREIEPGRASDKKKVLRRVFGRNLEVVAGTEDRYQQNIWGKITVKDRRMLLDLVKSRFSGPLDSYIIKIEGRQCWAEFIKEDISFPYPPVKGHLLGIDSAGRDVLARVLYGLRTSLTFGMLLVGVSMLLGIFTGALQGYYGGVIDITAQRIIEMWSALPFLYIMILMGSVYGRSFSLLLFCYGIFNWIGISYYIRAEFLRLRRQPFVEAAKCMGISSFKIIFKHILPNALVPVITFFPFSLVGAIGALAALDYLGFGLPPPTPSWGELLYQAQQFRWAWWLILYPSVALFAVMLFGVFIGEGLRNAYDPKRYSRLE